MRGSDSRTGSLFSYVDIETRVRPDHPLRTIRQLADAALETLSVDFSQLYSGMGRPSIAPEMLLRAMLLQAFYSIRSERQLMERLEFDLLFRWFVGLGVDGAVWDHSTFSKNRDRLLEGEIAAKFLAAVLAQPKVKRLLSSDHFSVDGTLIEAWASMKSFKPKSKNDLDPAIGSRWPQRRCRLQGSKAFQRHSRKCDRSRGQALPEGPGHGSQALLHGSHPYGKSLGPDCPIRVRPRPMAMRSGWPPSL